MPRRERCLRPARKESKCGITRGEDMGEISRSLDGSPRVRGSGSARLGTDLTPSGNSERRSVRVLLADDDPVTLESLTGLLSGWGYDPVPVRNGREAWDRLSAQDGPCLAVLDWMLPDIYGTEICRRLRASQSSRCVYIILLTGRDESSDVVRGWVLALMITCENPMIHWNYAPGWMPEVEKWSRRPCATVSSVFRAPSSMPESGWPWSTCPASGYKSTLHFAISWDMRAAN